jgi:exodeoxyribonuclease VII small subunit
MKKGTDTSSTEATQEESFESSMRQLELIVADLESGRLGLEASLTRYEEGVKRLKRCHQFLQAAERRIELITAVDSEGKMTTTPFSEENAPPAEGGTRSRRRTSG